MTRRDFLLLLTTAAAENNRGWSYWVEQAFAYHLIYNTVPSDSHNQLKGCEAGEAPYQSQKFTSKGRDAFEDLPHPWEASPRMQGQI